MSEIKIEEVGYGEYGYLVRMNHLLRQLSENAKLISWEDFLAMVGSQKNFFFFAAKDNSMPYPDDMVGMAVIFFIQRPEGWLGEIHSVVVDKLYRGRGIGDLLTLKLLETAEKMARDTGKSITLYLTSNPVKRVEANKMYLKHGFELVAEAVVDKETGKVIGTNLYKKLITPQ